MNVLQGRIVVVYIHVVLELDGKGEEFKSLYNDFDPTAPKFTGFETYRGPENLCQYIIQEAKAYVHPDFDPHINLSMVHKNRLAHTFEDDPTAKCVVSATDEDDRLTKTIPDFKEKSKFRKIYDINDRVQESYGEYEKKIVKTRPEHTTRISRLKTFHENEFESMDLIGEEMMKMHRRNVELGLMSTMSGKTSEEIYEHMKLRYFLPQKCSKKALDRLLQSVCLRKAADDKSQSFNLPTRSTYLKLVNKFGYADNQEDSFYKAIQDGLEASNLKKAKNIVDSGVNVNYDPFYVNEQARYQVEYNQMAQNGNPIDGVMVIDVDTENMADDLTEAERSHLKKVGRNISKIIKSINGFSTNAFKYSARYSYRELGMYFTAKYKCILPFGRTIPDLTWTYIFGLMIDPTDVLCLKEGDAPKSLRINGLKGFERDIMFYETYDYELIEHFNGILNLGDDGGASSTMARLLTNLQKLNRHSVQLSCVADERDELVELMDEVFYEMRHQERLSKGYNQSVNSTVSTVEGIVAELQSRNHSIQVIKSKILELTGFGKIASGVSSLAEKKALLSNININFGQEMASLVNNYGNPDLKLQARASFVKHYHHAVETGKGQFAYFLALLASRSPDVDAALVYLLGNRNTLDKFKEIVGVIKRDCENGVTPTSREFKQLPGMVDYRLTEAISLSPIQALKTSTLIGKREIECELFGGMPGVMPFAQKSNDSKPSALGTPSSHKTS